MLIAITAPQTNDRGPQYMEKVFSSVLSSIGRRDQFELQFGQLGGHVGLFCRFPDHLEHPILDPLRAKYPQCSVEALEDNEAASARETWSCTLRLTPELFPILRHKQFQDLVDGSLEDPLESLLGVVGDGDGLQSRIVITVRPADRKKQNRARAAVKKLDGSYFRRHYRLADFYAACVLRPKRRWLAWLVGFFAFGDQTTRNSQTDVSTSRFGEREDDVQAAADKIGGNLFEASIQLVVTAQSKTAASERLRTMRGAFAAFTKSRLATFKASRIRRGRPRRGSWFLLSHEELATLFHPATKAVASDRLAVCPFTELRAPPAIPSGDESGGVVLGRVKHKDDSRLFGINQEDRRRHVYVVGKTGMGKTVLLENLIRSDIDAGHGVAVLDPHGDLFERLLDCIPASRTNDVIVFDPADPEYAVAFNPLDCQHPEKRDQVASGVVSALKKLYDSWGPRLEDTLRNAVYAAIEQLGTLPTIMRILSDPAYRARTLPFLDDPIARAFWQLEFETWNDRYRTEAVAAIQNKLRPFLMNRRVRAILGQEGRSLNLRQVMDEGKILLVNLSKGQIGEDNSHLLGALLVTSLQQAAMSRADVSECERPDFYLYCDEFQNFSTGSFETILSEARKYRLNLTVAHQYLEQLDEATANAVFGNVGSMISFQVGTAGADRLAREFSKFHGQIKPEDFTGLPKYHAYIRLLHEGMPQPPFSMTTLPPRPVDEGRGAIVRKVSNYRYGRLRADVLDEMDNQRRGGRSALLNHSKPIPAAGLSR